MGQQFGRSQRLVIVREKKRRQTTRYWWGKGGPSNRTNDDAFLIFSVYYLDSILFYFQHQSEEWRNRCQQPNQVGENVQQGGTIDQLHLVILFFRLNALLIFRNWDRSYWTNSAISALHLKSNIPKDYQGGSLCWRTQRQKPPRGSIQSKTGVYQHFCTESCVIIHLINFVWKFQYRVKEWHFGGIPPEWLHSRGRT